MVKSSVNGNTKATEDNQNVSRFSVNIFDKKKEKNNNQKPGAKKEKRKRFFSINQNDFDSYKINLQD